MANNPFYPGYSPKKEGDGPVNPLYPGYYAGKPISRRPDSGYIQPVEFDFDIISDQIDEIGKTVSDSPLSGPKWVKDRVVDDWKSQLKVSVSPTSKINLTEMDDFATDDFAGATTTLSLNPKDWGAGEENAGARAKKQAIKTLNAWLKETTGIDAINRKYDASEISNKANQELFLMAMGYKDEEDYVANKPGRTERIGARAVAKRTVAAFSDFNEIERPLNIKGVSAQEIRSDGRIINHTDLYRETALAAADFIKQRDSYKGRDSSHGDFLSKALNAVDIELKDKYRENDNNKALGKHEGAIEFFDTRVETVNVVEKLQKDLSGKDGVTKELQKIVHGNREKVTTPELTTILDTSQKKINDAKKRIDELEKQAKDLLDKKEITQKSYDRYTEHTSKYKNHLDNLNKSIDDYSGGIFPNLSKLTTTLRGATPNKSFSSRTTFQDSLGGGLKRDLEVSLVSKDSDEIGAVFNDRDVEASGIELKAKRIGPLATRLRQDRIRFATKEVLDSFDSGGIKGMAEAYLWKRIKNEMSEKLRWYSSGEVLGDALKRKNYFGLSVTDEGVPINQDSKKYARFEKKYGYKVDVELDSEVSKILGQKKITVMGKEAAKDTVMGAVLKNDATETAANISILTDVKKYFKFDSKDPDIAKGDKELFSKLLNNDRSEETLDRFAKKMFNKSLSEMQDKDKEDLDKYLRKFEATGKWIEKKTAGKIKVLDKQKGGVILLDSAIFGVGEFTIPQGKYLNALSNSKMQLFLQANITQKNRDDQIQQIKRLLSLPGDKGYSRASMDKIVKLATGKDFKALSLAEKKEWLNFGNEFKVFSEWVKDQRGVFGKNVDDVDFRYKLFLKFKEGGATPYKPVNVDGSDAASRLFQSVYNKNNTLNDGYKLTDKKFIGRLEKINDKMQSIQKAWQKTFIGKTVKFANNWKEIASEKIVAALSKLLGIAATTTGPLAALIPVLQAIAEKAIKKSLDYATATLKAMVKFDFSDLDEMLRKDTEKIVVGCAVALVPLSILIFLPVALFFIVLASVISPVDTSRQNYEGYDQQSQAGPPLEGVYVMDFEPFDYEYVPTGTDPNVTPGPGPGPVPPPAPTICLDPAAYCVGNQGPSKYPWNGSNEVEELTKNAQHIVCNLEPGFWGNYNKPNTAGMTEMFHKSGGIGLTKNTFYNGEDGVVLWNQTKYDQNPYPPYRSNPPSNNDINNCSECLYWCTWLIRKAYNGVSPDKNNRFNIINLTLGAPNMCDIMANQELGWTWVENGPGAASKIEPGDVVCYKKTHVGMIYKIESDYIVSAEANACPFVAITMNQDGSYQADGSVDGIRGFGRYRRQ